MIEFPKRKPNRLKFYDYSSPGAYFITICTNDRKNYFWDIVGATIGRPSEIPLTKVGKIAEKAINNISVIYDNVTVDYYVIMPNHIHLLLQIHADENGRPMVAPTVDRVVKQLKGYITKRNGKSVWQKLYHDHVVRNRKDYERIAKYICENPMRWKEDCFYIE